MVGLILMVTRILNELAASSIVAHALRVILCPCQNVHSISPHQPLATTPEPYGDSLQGFGETQLLETLREREHPIRSWGIEERVHLYCPQMPVVRTRSWT